MDTTTDQNMVPQEEPTRETAPAVEPVIADSVETKPNQTVLNLGESTNRILAFIIDIIIVAIISGILGAIVAIPFGLFSTAIALSSPSSSSDGAFALLQGTNVVTNILTTLVGTLVWVIYYVLVPARFMQGQTIGKRVMKLRMVRTNGAQVDLVDMVKRNLLYIIGSLASMIPFVGLCFCCFWILIPVVNVIMLFTDPKRQTLNDKIADTVVVEA